jgi:hypothetical protein
MTTVYLVYSPSGETRKTLPKIDQTRLHFLVSYYYLQSYDRFDPPIKPARTLLDSGAFSAYQLGEEIDLEAYTKVSLETRWDEAVALDVIGDGDKSLANTLYMKGQGSKAFPVFHYGEPWDLLEEYCRLFDKVGLSCRFRGLGAPAIKFLQVCFSKCYPHKFHSFGWADEKVLTDFPFHSADTAAWNNGPAAFGNWRAFKGMPGPHKVQSLMPEVEFYWEMERRLRHRWAKEMARLESGIMKVRSK